MNKNIIKWAQDKGLIQEKSILPQLAKLQEETGELANAILKDNHNEQIDAIGDIQVVLIILCEQLGWNYEQCLEHAWDEIKNRKGKTINGSFIKED